MSLIQANVSSKASHGTFSADTMAQGRRLAHPVCNSDAPDTIHSAVSFHSGVQCTVCNSHLLDKLYNMPALSSNPEDEVKQTFCYCLTLIVLVCSCTSLIELSSILEAVLFDHLAGFLGDRVHGCLQMRAYLQRHHAGVYHSKAMYTINLEPFVHHAAFSPQ